jgi:uncharacterized protein involved in exopolysaccharide biosynthesis
MALRERWIRIAGFCLGVAVLTAAVAVVLKPWFTAETTLLPPTEGGDVFSNLAGLIENSALSRVGLYSASTPADIYIQILESRRLREAMILKFDLKRIYDLKGMDITLKELHQHVKVAATPAGVVSVRVEDTDRKRAAEMANFLVSELDRFNRETLQTRGKRTRQFLESRLAEVGQQMHAAEARMTEYERQHKVVLAADASAVRGIADVIAQKLTLQVKRAYMDSYSAPGNPGVREIDAEIAAFDRELDRLPNLKNEGARLVLDTEIQRKIFSYLTAQYEEARVQEMRDTPTISVLDVASPPEVRTRPKRTLMVLTSTLVAFLLSAGWVAFSLRKTARA